jgi:hypothetical protein
MRTLEIALIGACPCVLPLQMSKKRGAEKQITKDDNEDDDGGDVTVLRFPWSHCCAALPPDVLSAPQGEQKIASSEKLAQRK